MIVPQNSICITLWFFLVVHVALAPLTTTNFYAYQLASFQHTTFKPRLQLVLLGIMVFGNVILFGIMGEGPSTPFISWMVCVSAFLGVILSEFIVKAMEGHSGHEGAGADNNTLHILQYAQSWSMEGSVV